MAQQQAPSRGCQRTQSILLPLNDDDDERIFTPSASTQAATTPSRVEVIDRDSPMKSPCGLYYPDYVPRTLRLYNQRRLSVLPTFPTIVVDNNPRLLLVNVPVKRLLPTESALRQPGQLKSSFTITEHQTPATSFMVKQYAMYFVPLLERLQVDSVILDHNYTRLHYFLELFRTARMRALSSKTIASNELYLNEREFAPLSEFYVQMDVDLFYMKTCSFRDATARSDTEELFCSTIPECQYTMQRCGHCTV